MPMILAVPAGSPAKDLKGFLELARNSGAKWDFGSVGNGSMSHLAGEYYFAISNLNLTHVPCRGAAPMMTALVGSEIEASFVTGMDGTSMVQARKIRYLGIGTPKRASFLPNLPAIGEQVPGFSTVVWFGIMAPSGLPAPMGGRVGSHLWPKSAAASSDANFSRSFSTYYSEDRQIIKVFKSRWETANRLPPCASRPT